MYLLPYFDTNADNYINDIHVYGKYKCKNNIRQIADFLWSSIKDGCDGSPPVAFDKDGLELAFKYFCSSTLTMRLAGIAQINSHVSMFNEMCNTESVVEVETVGVSLVTVFTILPKSFYIFKYICRDAFCNL
jgi:hypothetical protein